MAEDILTRLREHPFRTHTTLDAADEIERLRAEIAHWREIALHFYPEARWSCASCREVIEFMKKRMKGDLLV